MPEESEETLGQKIFSCATKCGVWDSFDALLTSSAAAKCFRECCPEYFVTPEIEVPPEKPKFEIKPETKETLKKLLPLIGIGLMISAPKEKTWKK